jgi:hypothetical protein
LHGHCANINEGVTRTDEQHKGGYDGDAEGHAPPPEEALCAVVDELGHQDADGDHQLQSTGTGI